MTEQEFLDKALHSYKNIQCVTVEEFVADLNRIVLIKKLIDKIELNGGHRLILNHIVILFNVFGLTALPLILHKIQPTQFSVLFPFLLFLNRLPIEVAEEYGVDLDTETVKQLGKI
jgi:hypothetical protein